MKYIILIIMSAVFACSTNAIFAEEAVPFFEYGAKSFENDFDKASDTALKSYPYFITPSDKASTTTAEKRTGKSIAMDIGSMSVGDSTRILLSFHNTSTNPCEEYYYIEGYVKGFSTIPDTFMPYYEYNGGVAPVLDYGSDVAENGWIHIWYTVPILESYIVNGHVGWSYTKDGTSPQTIWIDDVSMRPIPKELVLKNRSCINTVDFDLTQIAVWGYSAKGIRHDIVNRSNIEWTVKSGNASVNGSTLKFESMEPQTIELEANFYGIKGSVTLQADKYSGACQWGEKDSISAVITKSEKAYSASVTNSGKDDSIYFISAVYHNGRLYDLDYKKETVAKGATVIIECEVPEIPKSFGGEVTSKAFIWSSLFGAKEFASFK